MANNCHIPDLVQAFSYVENGGLNLVLYLAKLLPCTTVALNSIILTTMCEQNKQYSSHHCVIILITIKTNKY